MLPKSYKFTTLELKSFFSKKRNKNKVSVFHFKYFKILVSDSEKNLKSKSKIAVIIPKKFFGNRSAVKRNRIKRIIFREFKKKFQKKFVIIFQKKKYKNFHADKNLKNLEKYISDDISSFFSSLKF